MLDSFILGLLEPNKDTLWAHLLVEAWVALEEKWELLGLGNEELMGRIKFHRPRVRAASSFCNIQAILIIFHRCGSNKTPLTAGFM